MVLLVCSASLFGFNTCLICAASASACLFLASSHSFYFYGAFERSLCVFIQLLRSVMPLRVPSVYSFCFARLQ
ncbi:stim-1 [Sesbania bispinosa]|nr:stim-1 [Sesbania bispinosa]